MLLNKKYNEKCDLWSCGVILYLMIAGYPPFYSQNKNEVDELIIEGKVTFSGIIAYIIIESIWETIDKDCINLIKMMLTHDIDKRISASNALQSAWIKKHAEHERIVTDKEILLSLNNLKNFRIQSLFQAAVLSYITSQQMSKEEEIRIRGIFDSFDKDKNGQVTKEELIDILRYMHGDCKRIYKEAEEIFNNIDLDNNGTIEYNGNPNFIIEFLVANLQMTSILNEENLRQAFAFYDTV